MNMRGSYYDLDSPQWNIHDVGIASDRSRIVFDFELEGYSYTVTLNKHNGTRFRGEAISRPGNEVAELSCRVFEDRSEEPALAIIGHTWKYPNCQACSWMVELELEEE